MALRAIMETGIVLAFGYWGFHTGKSTGIHLILGIITPLVGFGFWGLVDFHNAGKYAEPLRLAQELIISGIAALGIYVKGAHLLRFSISHTLYNSSSFGLLVGR